LIVSGDHLLDVLEFGFPMTVFSISFVPAALRSFVHHFHPAYTEPIRAFAKSAKDKLGNQVLPGPGNPKWE
jgi:hypothetical protein